MAINAGTKLVSEEDILKFEGVKAMKASDGSGTRLSRNRNHNLALRGPGRSKTTKISLHGGGSSSREYTQLVSDQDLS